MIAAKASFQVLGKGILRVAEATVAVGSQAARTSGRRGRLANSRLRRRNLLLRYTVRAQGHPWMLACVKLHCASVELFTSSALSPGLAVAQHRPRALVARPLRPRRFLVPLAQGSLVIGAEGTFANYFGGR